MTWHHRDSLTHTQRTHERDPMRAIDITTDGITTTLRCTHCDAHVAITEDDYDQHLTHDAACLHAARVKRTLRDAGIRPSRCMSDRAF